MKKFLFAFLFLSLTVWGQTLPGVRFGDGVPIWQGQSVLGVSPLLVAVSANATISFCSYPANAVPCTNKAQTYTDPTLGTACALNQQVVLATGNSCQATTDSLGNWGVWANPGQYAYTVTVGGQSFGPYPATLGGSSGGGGGSNPTPGVSNDLLFSNGTGGFQVDSGNIYYTPATHFLNAYGLNILGNAPFLINGLPNTSPCTPGPAGKIQWAFCPGPLATLSYNQDGPFPIARLGIVGQTATNLPTSTYMPLDANNTLPLGSLGDVGLMRVNSGVAGIVNPASLTSATRFNVYGGTNGFGSNSQMVALNYSASAGAFQLLTDKTGSASSLGLQFCTGGVSCNGWQLSGGTTPGVLFPVSGNTNPDIGAAGVSQVRNLFLQGALVNSGQYTQGCVNDATGTQIGLLAKRSSSLDLTTGQLECTLATTSDTTGLLGVVVGESSAGTCGVGSPCTTGVAYVAFKGQTTAAFDGTTTAKHWAIASTSTAGDLSDSGTACAAAAPTNVDVLGCIQAANTGAGTYAVDLALKSAASGGGAGSVTTTGSPTTNTLPLFSGSSSIGNSTVTQSSGSLPNVTIPRNALRRNPAAFNWSQSPGGSITAGSNTVTLTPVPYGLDSTFVNTGPIDTWLYLTGGTGTAEAVRLTATTCTTAAAGSGSCTVTFTAINNHTGAWTIGSATGGVEEAITDAEGVASTSRFIAVDVPCDTGSGSVIPLYAPVMTHGNHVNIFGEGCALFQQNFNWGPAIIMGDRFRGAEFFYSTLSDFSMVSGATPQPQINQISSASRTGCPASCVATFAFSAPHDFTQQDVNNGVDVIVGGYLNDNTYAGLGRLLSIVDSTHITVQVFASSNPTTTYAGGWVVKDFAAIQDNLSIGGRLNQITLQSTGAARWMNDIIPLVDQSFTVTVLDNQGTASVLIAPTDSYQGSLIYAPGPNGPNGAVGFIYGLNCSLQGAGNCITWDSGDDLMVSDSIIQGYCDIGIRMSLRRGGFGALTVKGTHFESAGCGAPLSLKTTAPIVSNGASVSNISALNTSPSVAVPFYGSFGDHLKVWYYYVQAVSNTSDTLCTSQPGDVRCGASLGNGPLLFAGWAQADSTIASSVPIVWFAAPAATSYNIYRTDGVVSTATQTAPFGTGNYLIQSAVNPLVNCTDAVCTLIDSVGFTPSSVTIPTYGLTSSTYFPYFPMWPASVMMSVTQDAASGGAALPAIGKYSGTIGGGYVISEEIPGQDTIQLMSPWQGVFGASSTAAAGTVLFKGFGSQVPSNSTVEPGYAYMFPAKLGFPGQSDGSTLNNRKGVFNFTPLYTVTQYPYSLFTLFDSNLAKTLATSTRRPTSDTGDCEFGLLAAGETYTRCATGMAEIVNGATSATPDRSLGSSGETLKPRAFSTLSTCNSGLEGTRASVTDSTTSTFGATISGSGTNHVPAYCNGTNWVVD